MSDEMAETDGEWDFYMAEVGEHLASTFLDLSLRRRAPLPGLPWSSRVRLHMRNPRADGLSSQEEYDQLIAIEDALVVPFDGDAHVRYVGRVTAEGVREFYFFVADSDAFAARARSVFARFPDYQVSIGGRLDAEWSAYFDELVPDARQMEGIRNRRVCESLQRHGDDGRAPRCVDHWAYFSTASSRDAFADWVEREGFEVRDKMTLETADARPFSVQFFRDDVPVEIDDVTFRLREEASAHGGAYDGWECPVERPTTTDA